MNGRLVLTCVMVRRSSADRSANYGCTRITVADVIAYDATNDGANNCRG